MSIMIVILAVLVFIIIGIAGYAVTIYNGLIRVRNNVDKAWANIDVLLKQRHDELPKLIETCKGYMKYEQSLLEKITAARTAFLSAKTTDDKAKSENMLAGALKQLFAVAENYPELKANSTFQHLQSRISGLENEIADRREFVNESVTVYNIRIQQFPDVILANMLAYQRKLLLEVTGEDKKDVKVSF